MRSHRIGIWIVCSAIVAIANGCGGCADPAQPGWQLQDKLPDVAVDASDVDLFDAPPLRDTPQAPPPDVIPDSGPPDAPEVPGEPIDYDPTLWTGTNPCEGEVSYPSPDRAFGGRRGSFGSGGTVMTRSEYLGRRSSIDGTAMPHLIVDGSLLWSDHLPFDFYLDPTRDIDLHVYAINGYQPEDYRLSLTVLVDHEPVQAEFVWWNPDRTEKWMEKTASGINIPFRSDLEIVDITIPREVFDEERAYELIVSAQLNSTEWSPDGETQRFIVYNKSLERPDRPCAEPALGDDLTFVEWHLSRKTASGMSLLFHEGVTDTYSWQNAIEVAPGETREFFVSMMRTSVRTGPKPSVHVPVLNGEPIGDAWWVMQGSQNTEEYGKKVDGRKSFEVTFPREPGVYEVQVVSAADPYELWRDLDGELVPGIWRESPFTAGSNVIRALVAGD